MIADTRRDSRSDREVEVHVCNFLDLLLLYRRGDLGALFGGGAAVAEVAALPAVLLSEVEGLVSAVGVFRSFEVVVASGALALPSGFHLAGRRLAVGWRLRFGGRSLHFLRSAGI